MNLTALLRISPACPLVLAIAAALPLTASAQDTGAYVGLGAGRVSAEIDDSGITSALQSGGYGISRLSTSDDGNHYKVLAGYSFHPHFALEGSYFNLGSFDFEADLLPAATQIGKAGSINGFALDLVGTLPLQDQWSAFARLGVNNAKVRQSFSGTATRTGLVNDSARGWNQKYGVGLSYAISDTLALRAELERYDLEDNAVLKDNVETFTLGVVYRFGAGAPEAQRTPVSVAPTPTPPPPPAPPAALPIELTLSAASLFDFDRTEIKPEGAQALDKLVADMRTLDYELVLVTGHTDRIGSRDYNLGLSQRRADAVKAYLVNAGIPAARITSRGVNSDEPVTRPEDCRGTGSAQAQIACLAPDRRVVVLVTGSEEP